MSEGGPLGHTAQLADQVRNALENARKKPSIDEQLAQQDIADRKAERGLRRLYAFSWLGIVGVQLLILNLFVFLVGVGFLNLNRWVFGGFLAGTFAEVVGVVLVITKSLFPTKRSS